MAAQSRAALKGYFNTDDQPTEANFADLIDSVPNLTDDTVTGTGALVKATSPTLVTPVLGAATCTSLAATAAITSSSATAGIGYATGAGGTVTQLTNKSTGVTLNKVCGQITMNNAALAAGAVVSFVVTNSAVAATDGVHAWVVSGGTANAYRADVTAVGAGSFTVTVENLTGGSLSEAPVIGYAVLKAVTS